MNKKKKMDSGQNLRRRREDRRAAGGSPTTPGRGGLHANGKVSAAGEDGDADVANEEVEKTSRKSRHLFYAERCVTGISRLCRERCSRKEIRWENLSPRQRRRRYATEEDATARTGSENTAAASKVSRSRHATSTKLSHPLSPLL